VGIVCFVGRLSRVLYLTNTDCILLRSRRRSSQFFMTYYCASFLCILFTSYCI
jgi:hypothetical protein